MNDMDCILSTSVEGFYLKLKDVMMAWWLSTFGTPLIVCGISAVCTRLARKYKTSEDNIE